MEEYTHLHLGGVRLILTLHRIKCLSVTARLALLDTRFKEYQHAVIRTVLTTLHAGSVLLTFYPNFISNIFHPLLRLNRNLDLPGLNHLRSIIIPQWSLTYSLLQNQLLIPNQPRTTKNLCTSTRPKFYHIFQNLMKLLHRNRRDLH